MRTEHSPEVMTADSRLPGALRSGQVRCSPYAARAATAGLVAGACGALLPRVFPALELRLFAHGAAWLAGFLTGSPVECVRTGWALSIGGYPVAVTVACRATDFFFMVAAIISWQLARRRSSVAVAVAAGLGAALPVAIFVNSVRVVTVAQVHRWAGPLLPDAYDSILHLLAGVAVFLPSLVALNLLLEFHGRLHAASKN